MHMKKTFNKDDYNYLGTTQIGLCTAKVYRHKNAPTGNERKAILTEAVRMLIQGCENEINT